MKRLLAILFVVGWTASAQAQFLMTGVSGHGGAAGGSGYVGIGDLGVPNISNYYALRCYSASYTGNVAALNLTTGGTSAGALTCTAGVLGALPAGCTGSGVCNVSTLYDQVGGKDVVQATNANRPPLLIADGTSICGAGSNWLTSGRYCIQGDGVNFALRNTSGLNLAQPIGFVAVAMRSTGTAGASAMNCNDASSISMGPRNAVANNWSASAGTQATGTANDAVWHVAALNFARAASNLSFDSAAFSTVSMGANVCGAVSFNLISGASSSIKLTGFMTEAIVTGTTGGGTALSQANVTAIYGNEKAYWGAIP